MIWFVIKFQKPHQIKIISSELRPKINDDLRLMEENYWLSKIGNYGWSKINILKKYNNWILKNKKTYQMVQQINYLNLE